MSSLSHALLGGRPWAMTGAGLALVADAVERLGPTALQTVSADRLERGHGADRRGPVGVIHVKGPLFREDNLLSDLLGGSSYARLALQVRAALDSPEVGAICFIVDSPGGEVAGCSELANIIFAARGRKPMASYVGGTCASAAYWLASATGAVYVDSTALVGSIGCKAILVDDTGAQKLDGVKRIEVVSSQSPNKGSDASDPAYLGRVRKLLDDTASVFIADVAKFRGVRAQTVVDRFGQGDVLVGASAVEAGLADGLRSAEAVITDLASKAAAKQSHPFTPSASSATRAVGAEGRKQMNSNDKTPKRYAKLCEARGLDAAHVDTRARLALASGLGPNATVEAIVNAARAQKAEGKLEKTTAKNARLGLAAGATKAVRREVIEGTARAMNMSASRVKELTTMSASELERQIDEKRAGKA